MPLFNSLRNPKRGQMTRSKNKHKQFLTLSDLFFGPNHIKRAKQCFLLLMYDSGLPANDDTGIYFFRS